MIVREGFYSLILVCAFGGIHYGLGAQQPSTNTAPRALPELWATLQGKIDFDKLDVGAELTAKVSQRWSYSNCKVEEHAILHGKVVSITGRSDASRSVEVSVLFRAPCTDGTHPLLILMAVFYPTGEDPNQMDNYESLPHPYRSIAANPLDSVPNTRSGESASLPLARFNEVKGVHHLSLSAAKGPQGSTVLLSSDKHLKLNAGTRLAFVPVPQGK